VSWYADTSRTARFNALLIVPVPAAPAPAAWRRLPPSAARSQTGGAGRHKCRSCEIGILVTFSHRLLQALIEQWRGIGSCRRFKTQRTSIFGHRGVQQWLSSGGGEHAALIRMDP
jgi:hypothetical protein